MSDLYHVLLDLGTGDYHFPGVEYHIVYATCTMFTKHVYAKSPMFIKQSPTLRSPPPPPPSYHDNGHKKNAAKS